MGTGLDIGGGEERQELVAEVRVHRRRRPTAVELIERLPTLDVAAAWEGEPGRSPADAGSPSCSDPEQAEVAWIPATLLADDRVALALAGHHDVHGATTSSR